MMKRILIALVLPLALAGCGGEYSAKSDTAQDKPQAESVTHNESDISNHLGLDEYGVVQVGTLECEAAVVMTDASMVEMYDEAGDTVATNPDGTAGVKNTSAETEACQSFFTEGLSTFPDGEPVDVEGAVDDGSFKFGETAVHESGVEVTVEGPQKYSPSGSAFGVGKNNAKFTITIKNNSGNKYDPNMFFATVASGGNESEEIFDSENGLNGAPMTTVLPGKSITFDTAFAVKNNNDIVMEVQPSIGQFGPIIFQNGS